MKPSKSKVYCKDCGRAKILFETEKKAETFIKFNSEEIESETGYSPVRSYFCILCNGWHVTSKKDSLSYRNRAEIITELINQYSERKETIKKKKAEIVERKKKDAEIIEKRLKLIENLIEELSNKHLIVIERHIKVIESNIGSEFAVNCIGILNSALAELEIAKKCGGSKKRKKKIEEKLNKLRNEIIVSAIQFKD